MNPRRPLIHLLLVGAFQAPTDTPTGWRTPVNASVTSAIRLPIEGELPSFGHDNEWLNSPPLSPAGLRGKVVLVDICTYSCINWLRHLPYVRAWGEKYADRGLVVIGVHSPEFDFEKEPDNVRRAVKAMGLTHPIVIDNDHAIWRAFENEAWPALYFVDAQGKIRHHQYGEGAYDVGEQILQQLLSEAGQKGVPQGLVSIEPQGVGAQADWPHLRTPETYVGYEQGVNLSSPGGARRDQPATYAAPAQLALNHWALVGNWKIGRQATVLAGAGGKIVFRFHARDVHLVMGASAASSPVRYRVRLDGRSPGTAHGLDADSQGDGVAKEPRLYQLIRQSGTIEDRTFEIEFLDTGIETFSFTFG